MPRQCAEQTSQRGSLPRREGDFARTAISLVRRISVVAPSQAQPPAKRGKQLVRLSAMRRVTQGSRGNSCAAALALALETVLTIIAGSRLCPRAGGHLAEGPHHRRHHAREQGPAQHLAAERVRPRPKLQPHGVAQVPYRCYEVTAQVTKTQAASVGTGCAGAVWRVLCLRPLPDASYCRWARKRPYTDGLERLAQSGAHTVAAADRLAPAACALRPRVLVTKDEPLGGGHIAEKVAQHDVQVTEDRLIVAATAPATRARITTTSSSTLPPL